MHTDETIRILMLEDSENDCELVMSELRRSGLIPQFRRTESGEAFLAALSGDPGAWDIIISDFYLPSYTGMDALKQVKDRGVELPFILVSGTVGEDHAVNAMKAGAADYILKGNLTRLAPAVKREIAEHRNRMRMKNALRESDEKFHQAQKMEAIGQLAGGVAHDFNNILAAVVLYAEGIIDREPTGSSSSDDASQIKKACERAASLTRQLLTFSRKQTFLPEVIEIGAILDNVVPMLQRLLGAQIKIKASLGPSPGKIKTDPRQLEQVLLNLAVNARDAMPAGGVVTISYHSATRSRPEGGAVANWCVLEFQDTGAGMTPEVMRRIFEPFYTTKGLKGTGLGLSTVYGIVQHSGGFVDVWSELGAGTKFSVFLPLLETPGMLAEPGPESEAPVKKPGSILIIEDNEDLRQILGRALRKRGFKMAEAPDCAAARTMLETPGATFDILVVDVTLPDGNGIDLAREARMRFPEAVVILTSGYPGGEKFFEETSQKKTAFIAKPFTSDQLLAQIDKALGTKS